MGEDFYQKIENLKDEKNLNWNDIGAVVDKADAAIRQAFSRKSLKDYEKQKIEKHFFGSSSFDKELLLDSVRGLTVRQISEIVITRKDEFLEDVLFSEFIENQTLKRILKIERNSKN